MPTKMQYSKLPIWTLEARGNMLLASMAAQFNMTGEQVRHEIRRVHSETVSVLQKKDLDYRHLKASLEPSRDKLEIALIFDIEKLGSGNYATVASRQIIPALRSDACHSVLQGDIIGPPLNLLHQLVATSINASPFFDADEVGFYFAVYINNLTPSDVRNIHSRLCQFPAYQGHVPCSHASYVRTVLSHMLAASYLKVGRRVISAHEDDVEEEQDRHLGAWDWGTFGYIHRSVHEYRFGLFLTYKIEREVGSAFDDDERFALNAISDKPADISRFRVEVAASKMQYLRNAKAGILKRLDLGDSEAEELQRLVQEKLHSSYFYNLRYLDEHDTSLFNLLLELPGRRDSVPEMLRVMASLEYNQPHNVLRLVTFY